jgi:hypothetical protein
MNFLFETPWQKRVRECRAWVEEQAVLELDALQLDPFSRRRLQREIDIIERALDTLLTATQKKRRRCKRHQLPGSRPPRTTGC